MINKVLVELNRFYYLSLKLYLSSLIRTLPIVKSYKTIYAIFHVLKRRFEETLLRISSSGFNQDYVFFVGIDFLLYLGFTSQSNTTYNYHDQYL